MNKKNEVSPVVAGIVGVVAGATAATAAVMMSNKKNQKKMTAVIDDAKKGVVDYIESVKSQPVIKKGLKEIKETVNSV